MSDSQENRETAPESRQVTLSALLALGLLGVAVVVLVVVLAPSPGGTPIPATGTPSPVDTPYSMPFSASPTAAKGQRVERAVVAFTTLVPTFTPYLTPTIAPVTPIPWAEEDINALTWLCYEEVRGMGEARFDACLSVISTVRRRYAYDDDPYHEDTIAETLLREDQFPIDFDLEQPAPDPELRLAVDQYQWGARGSCTGYLYYDSVPGGPSLCVIRGANRQFMELALPGPGDLNAWVKRPAGGLIPPGAGKRLSGEARICVRAWCRHSGGFQIVAPM